MLKEVKRKEEEFSGFFHFSFSSFIFFSSSPPNESVFQVTTLLPRCCSPEFSVLEGEKEVRKRKINKP